MLHKCGTWTYRPFEGAILMILQERGPDKNVSYSSLLGYIVGIGLAGAHGAETATALIDGLRGLARRGLVPDGVEDVL